MPGARSESVPETKKPGFETRYPGNELHHVLARAIAQPHDALRGPDPEAQERRLLWRREWSQLLDLNRRRLSVDDVPRNFRSIEMVPGKRGATPSFVRGAPSTPREVLRAPRARGRRSSVLHPRARWNRRKIITSARPRPAGGRSRACAPRKHLRSPCSRREAAISRRAPKRECQGFGEHWTALGALTAIFDEIAAEPLAERRVSRRRVIRDPRRRRRSGRMGTRERT